MGYGTKKVSGQAKDSISAALTAWEPGWQWKLPAVLVLIYAVVQLDAMGLPWPIGATLAFAAALSMRRAFVKADAVRLSENETFITEFGYFDAKKEVFIPGDYTRGEWHNGRFSIKSGKAAIVAYPVDDVPFGCYNGRGSIYPRWGRAMLLPFKFDDNYNMHRALHWLGFGPSWDSVRNKEGSFFPMLRTSAWANLFLALSAAALAFPLGALEATLVAIGMFYTLQSFVRARSEVTEGMRPVTLAGQAVADFISYNDDELADPEEREMNDQYSFSRAGKSMTLRVKAAFAKMLGKDDEYDLLTEEADFTFGDLDEEEVEEFARPATETRGNRRPLRDLDSRTHPQSKE